MPHTYKVFISSVQEELKVERRSLRENILHDLVLALYVKDVFLFEDVPAKDQAPSAIRSS